MIIVFKFMRTTNYNCMIDERKKIKVVFSYLVAVHKTDCHGTSG